MIDTPSPSSPDPVEDVSSSMAWLYPFLIYGGATGLPIPCLGWVWLSLSIAAAWRLGWRRGLLGMATYLITTVVVRLIITAIVLAGEY